MQVSLSTCSTVLLISHGLYFVLAETNANAISLFSVFWKFWCVFVQFCATESHRICVKDTGRSIDLCCKRNYGNEFNFKRAMIFSPLNWSNWMTTDVGFNWHLTSSGICILYSFNKFPELETIKSLNCYQSSFTSPSVWALQKCYLRVMLLVGWMGISGQR